MRINIFVLLFCLLLGSCKSRKAEDVVYLIPKNYQGVVIIFFDDPNGKDTEYRKENRVYRIPANGILKTKFLLTKSLHQQSFFYIDSLGERENIPYYTAIDLREHRIDSSRIICYNLENAVTKDRVTSRKKNFSLFLVSTIKNLDSIAKTRSMKMWEILNEQ